MGRLISFVLTTATWKKLSWSYFKKLLPTKKDKQEFDKVFHNARLYILYLGNVSNPIVVESVMMDTSNVFCLLGYDIVIYSNFFTLSFESSR